MLRTRHPVLSTSGILLVFMDGHRDTMHGSKLLAIPRSSSQFGVHCNRTPTLPLALNAWQRNSPSAHCRHASQLWACACALACTTNRERAERPGRARFRGIVGKAKRRHAVKQVEFVDG
ncbi:hypothetical protein CBR_g17081 [Chara braunii]|uniref:Uncharacterized protein n=1 Tax=Chara braunii TaxID=69332 RepID=A0A388KUL0_CHABU|nr:hypothetical protein CBR_g17081 [Chara braunii]|eukprot:GBG73741.1 hypothetical protein CBR_g17081 [Chara braunii]